MTTVSKAARRPRARAFLDMIAFEHSVFSLPFAYLAIWFAAGGAPTAAQVGWVTLAMVSARTVAMAANRIIDRRLDATNPRTATRELVTGAVSVRAAIGGAAAALAAFVLAAFQLEPIVRPLIPVALIPLIGYPYLKRFTWACHFGLGLAQAIAPVGAWLAVSGEWSLAGIALGLAVGVWVTGFDLIYATQDVAHDRASGIHSIPADFSVPIALRLSAALHVATVALLGAVGFLLGLGALWWLAVAVAAGALTYEHTLVAPDDLSRVNRAFFTVNGWIGVLVGALGITESILRSSG
ncbi:MAG TPA: 4-hydroxybenzoate octaprenyltransferase [Egibacteraceae bacterium]|nr:4-hydroxybenzoate octaprenyltransferase [Egibacteraceae bacterium]